MSGITIPTLDEITGHTVMAKLRSLCKRFIGLAEEVDEKIDAPLAEAHLAVETANATLATAQNALEDAQSAVTTANSASETATQASESAQESAETVAGYDTRLTAVENGKINITDINNYAIGLTGNQDFTGTKIAVDSYVAVKATSPNFDEGSALTSGYEKVLTQTFDSQNNLVFDMRIVRSSTNMRTNRQVLFNKTTDNRNVTAYLDLRIDDTGVVSLLLIKTVDGAETGRQTLATISN